MGHNGIIAASRFLGGGVAPPDTTPPTIGTLTAPTNVCQYGLTLNWTPATDNVGVTGYKIYRNAVLYADAGNVLTYDVTGLTPETTYNWQVLAYDLALNESTLSNIQSTTTGAIGLSIFYINPIGQVDGITACGQIATLEVYKTGTPNIPSNGDELYTNSCGVDLIDGNWDYYSNESFSFTISFSGVIGSVTSCE